MGRGYGSKCCLSGREILGFKLSGIEEMKGDGKRVHRIILVNILIMVQTKPLYAGMFQVWEIGPDSREATLRGQETGDLWVVKGGDAVGNWRIFKVESDGVTIGKWGDKGETVSTKLPPKKHLGPVMPRPRCFREGEERI